ncbi:MAG TPA: 3-hydroxybutyrate dehydrogenase [Nocardioidaceae bacterium]|jgi:3-hydroxybutyrate dehydrogenase|nr:3-hydroxybutyrate dehydrogenase [Nocardioidaceae bacterium]
MPDAAPDRALDRRASAAPAPSGLRGRRALVTGGASGIGRACVTRLAEAGAHVVVLDQDAAGARVAADAVGGEALVADLSSPRFLEDLDPRVDVLVNNAGFQHVAPLEEFPRDTFTTLLRVMVEAPFWLIAHALPHMRAQSWGRIVNISSVHGLIASPHKAAYVTAKHALEGLSKVTALEGAEHGITSNCVNPGFVRTPLVERQIADHARIRGWSEQEVVERVILERSALKRLIEPDEVAAMAGYLCTPAADAVTGASLVLDGGWTAH